MKRRAALVLVVLILLSGVPGTTLAGTQEEKAGTINPLFKNPLKELSTAEDGEREALIALMEALLNETLNGDIIVSDTMRIRNIHWNGTSLIFQIWWYDNNQPIAMQTYKWENPERALGALRKAKTGETTEESLAKAFTVEPLSTSRGLQIIDVDYLTNDNNGEYVVLYNGGSSTFTASGWYLMDSYAYNNERCWVNETPSIPKNHCYDSFGRDHVRKFSVSLGPGEVRRILVASSSSSAILNNAGDTVYLIDNKGNLADIYSYTGAPKVTVRRISYSPSPPKEGDYLHVTINLDNSGPVNGKGHIELYLDGVLIKKSAVTVYAYHTWEYKMYNVWRATPGSHVLTARFVPDYGGSPSSSSTTLKVSESRPYISGVSHTMLVEKHPIRFHVNVVNPSGNRKDVILKLFVDGVEISRLNSYVYKRWSFDLWWKKPGRGFHDVEIKLYNANGTVVYSTWARNIYVRENSPPEVVRVDLPPFLYSNEWSNGTIVVNDAEGDRVNVSVEVVGRFSFRRTGLYPGYPHRFPLAPIYNHTNCRENVTIRFTPVDEYGKVGETVTKVVPVLTDSDKDGWCNALEWEYGMNPYSNDTDGDGVIDSKDVDPLRDVKVTVYILRAKALDDVDSSIAGHNPADMSLELTVNGQTKTLFLTDNQDDYEKKIIPITNPLVNVQSYAIALTTFDVPDDKEVAIIRFHLYDRDDNGKRTEMDVSPSKGTVAVIHYNLKTGTWSGDDYQGDEEKYFGYGHLSGCGDGSCNVGPKEPDKDLKVYVKYESILEKAKINGEIIDIKTIEGVNDVTVKDGTTAFSIVKPKNLKVARVRLENGTVINVTLVNTYGTDVTSPGNEVVATTSSSSPAEILSNGSMSNDVKTLKGDVKVVTSSGEMPLKSDLVVSYSSADDTPDGEIWFVITTNDADGIPFYREIELNKELEANGFTERFDPSDRKADDMNGDYDGDGVPNSVELFIGKDPAKRDILGISLTVSTEWALSEEDKRNLVYSIRKASDFVYDYTDGYAMITSVQIWDDKRQWDDADVRVHKTKWVIPQTRTELLYKGWPKASIGGYWIKRFSNATESQKHEFHIMMSKKIISAASAFSDQNIVISIGDVDWGKTLGHELGHYVFWLYDEYLDVKGRNYYSIKDYKMNALKMWFGEVPPHSVMNVQFRYSELSWPQDYARFNSTLTEMFKNSVEEHVTEQWKVSRSCWEAFAKFIREEWYITIQPDNLLVHKPSIIPDMPFSSMYVPVTGPYTGVGYFMEVTWK